MKNAVAICCLNASVMLDLPIPTKIPFPKVARIEATQRGQAELLRRAAEISEIMFIALTGIIAESDLQDEEIERGAEVMVSRLEAALAKCRAAIAQATVTAP